MTETTFFLIGLAGLVAASAFFSGSETALFSLSAIQVRKFQGQKQGRGPKVAQLISRPRNLLISLLIGNMVVNIFSSSLSATFFRRLLANTAVSHISELITVSTMTIIIIIFGEIAPKAYAIQNSEKMSKRVAPIIKALYILVTPLRLLLFKTTDGIIKYFGRAIGSQDSGVSSGELRMAATLGHSAGAIGEHEKQLIHGVLRLEHRKVQEMMTAKMDITALDISMPLDDIRRTVREKSYMRIPIYEGDIDGIIGMLYAKDLFLVGKGEEKSTGIRDILKPAYFVPETLEVDVLLEEFRKRRTHIAIVVDEYGSISGLITLEDILEIIVGRMYDKADETEFFSLINPNTIRVKGLLPIEDFNEVFGADLEDKYVVTMGGYVTHALGRIPLETQIFEINGLEFTITKSQKSRIDEMLVRRRTKAEEA